MNSRGSTPMTVSGVLTIHKFVAEKSAYGRGLLEKLAFIKLVKNHRPLWKFKAYYYEYKSSVLVSVLRQMIAV
jgi:hypothetical protein